MSLTRGTIKLDAGEDAGLGLHAFDDIGGEYYLVASTDGPSVADNKLESDDEDVATITSQGRVSIPADATSGSRTTVTIRVQADGIFLTGDFDKTLTVTVVVR